MTVRGHIVREFPSSFQDIVFDMEIDGNLTETQVAALAREAGRHCFVENTLAKAIPLETEVRLNNRKILILRRDPDENIPVSTKQAVKP